MRPATPTIVAALCLVAALGAACMRTPTSAASPPQAATPTSTPAPSRPRAALPVLEARREAATAELLQRSRDEPAAIRALGRVADPPAIAGLLALLADADPIHREHAARALGSAALLGADVGDAEARLIAGHRPARGRERVALVEALGRLGSAAAVPVLAASLASERASDEREAAAIALGVLGRRGVALDEPTRAHLLAIPRTSELAFAATYAIAHEHAPAVDRRVREWLLAGWDSPETNALRLLGLVRRGAVPAVNQCVAKATPLPLFQVGADPQSRWLSLVLGLDEAALTSWVIERTFQTLQPAMWRAQQPNLHGGAATRPPAPRTDPPPSLAAARGVLAALTCITGAAHGDQRTHLRELTRVRDVARRTLARSDPGAAIPEPFHPRAFDLALARIDCQLALLLAHDRRWRPPLTCGREGSALAVDEPQILEASALVDGFGGTWPERQVRLQALLTSPDPRVRIAAITAIARMWPRPASAAAVEAWLLAALDDRTPGVVGAAADAINEHHKPPGPPLPADGPLAQRLAARARDAVDREPELYATLVAALATTRAAATLPVCEPALTHANPSVRAAARGCVKALRGSDPGPLPPAGPLPLPALDPTRLQGHSVRWVLTTEYGPLTIDLDPEVAPWAVAMIVDLTQRGFYDGLGFHRDVPGFVLQGGDPEGTGWGGPGYTLPSEPSAGRFDRGAVGIADAGKDTGGSQFFFMHARAPHLEGRYTWVGRLRTEDHERLALLSIGDRILKAEVHVAPVQPRGEHATMTR